MFYVALKITILYLLIFEPVKTAMKKTLDFDYEDHLDFDLMGMVCAYKDFRLCFEINKILGIELCKAEDLEMKKEKRGSASLFSLYNFGNADHEQFIVIANKGSNGYFINELKHIDYFLLIRDLAPFNSLDTIIERIKQISIITSITLLEASDYKSSENFLLIDE